ncbi:hypothetical protein ACN4GL_28665, partial [Burkholderia pseudomallei]
PGPFASHAATPAASAAAAANARGATKNERCWRAYRGKRRIIDPAVSSGKGASVCHPHDSSMTPDRQLNESVTTCCCQT